MTLPPTEAQQQEMRHAHYDGAPGILVSGLVWIAAALVCYQLGMNKAVWTLLIGGALIHPISLIEMCIRDRCSAGSRKAAVWPLPVWLETIQSPPASAFGMVCT